MHKLVIVLLLTPPLLLHIVAISLVILVAGVCLLVGELLIELGPNILLIICLDVVVSSTVNEVFTVFVAFVIVLFLSIHSGTSVASILVSRSTHFLTRADHLTLRVVGLRIVAILIVYLLLSDVHVLVALNAHILRLSPVPVV